LLGLIDNSACDFEFLLIINLVEHGSRTACAVKWVVSLSERQRVPIHHALLILGTVREEGVSHTISCRVGYTGSVQDILGFTGR
jgi:hypothetical protein